MPKDSGNSTDKKEGEISSVLKRLRDFLTAPTPVGKVSVGKPKRGKKKRKK